MRIVVFSNLYPPLFLGGYELGAALVVAELQRRGHELLLLSSRNYFLQQDDGFQYVSHPGANNPAVLDNGLCVFSSLPRLFLTNPLRSSSRALSSLLARRRYRRALAAFRPERVLLFSPRGVVAPVLHDLADVAHKAGAEVHAYVSDYWLAEWPDAQPLLRALERLRHSKRLLLRLAGGTLSRILAWTGLMPARPPHIDHFFYCSEHIRRISSDKAWGAASQDVVPWGLASMERFQEPPPGHFQGTAPLTLLFAGQLHEHKGLGVLLQAAADCRRPHTLVVLGDDTTPYAQECKRRAAELNMTARVHFLGRKTHAETLALLGKLGHVLVVPSLWDEPFSLVVLEGMALGLPVVVSDTGGSAEALRDGATGFLFQRGRADQLTTVLDRLEMDRALCARVGGRARRSALYRFKIERMVDRLLEAGHAEMAPALVTGEVTQNHFLARGLAGLGC